eukprot:5902289-Lingulodinium_polyedra.AAC.1
MADSLQYTCTVHQRCSSVCPHILLTSSNTQCSLMGLMSKLVWLKVQSTCWSGVWPVSGDLWPLPRKNRAPKKQGDSFVHLSLDIWPCPSCRRGRPRRPTAAPMSPPVLQLPPASSFDPAVLAVGVG